MLYINEDHIQMMGINWESLIQVIRDAVYCLHENDYAQPIKPYLRFKESKNRIIAMPAYVGGSFNMAGIKWIASFPDNIKNGIPRANSIVILNDSSTGQPVVLINTALLSILRTAAVSGLILKNYLLHRKHKNLKIGIVGWGPIGKYHFDMCCKILGDQISDMFLYDLIHIDQKTVNTVDFKGNLHIAETWEEVYENVDIFITCTVSKAPYIDKKPKKGALLLNVSLRDFKVDIYDYVKGGIVVDDWDEVCRENTDIERLSDERGLRRDEVYSISDVVLGNCSAFHHSDQTIMFNPMGMAVFDIAIGSHYLEIARELNIGCHLA